MNPKTDLTLLLPRATRWAEERERDILAKGRILRPHEIPIADAVGVKAPERIRIRSVKVITPPKDAELAAASEKFGLHWITMAGLTLGHGILLREGAYTLELSRTSLSHVCAVRATRLYCCLFETVS